MKIRNGFVSNSSSSSFIVIDAKAGRSSDFKDSHQGETFIIGKCGETEFGWGPGTCRDVYSRINFAYLQSEGDEDWREMLINAIKDYTGADTVESILSDNCDEADTKWSYVDHQSSASEGMNVEMFDNESALYDFLFGLHSKIVLDNDNQ